jgi:copper chaperone NosL
MRKLSRVVLAGAALALGVLYLTPLWRIGLTAPQYPEGLGLFIWVNRITGDLQSINGLNHYIGMRVIVPETFPELRIMPVAVGALMCLGLLAAAWGKRKALYAWCGLFLAGALAGLVSFYRWGYAYGHELDPRAAIKIPDMSYQPPLLGGKQLLNFHAESWPAVGGWVAVAVLLVALTLSVIEWRAGRALTG